MVEDKVISYPDLMKNGLIATDVFLGRGLSLKYRNMDGQQFDIVVTDLPSVKDIYDLQADIINAVKVIKKPLWKLITDTYQFSRPWIGGYVTHVHGQNPIEYFVDTHLATDWVKDKVSPSTARNIFSISKIHELAKIGRRAMDSDDYQFANYHVAITILRNLRTEYLQQVFNWVCSGGMTPTVIKLKKPPVAKYGVCYMYIGIINDETGDQLFVEPVILASGKTMYRVTTEPDVPYDAGFIGWADTMSRVSAFVSENQRKDIISKLLLNHILDLT